MPPSASTLTLKPGDAAGLKAASTEPSAFRRDNLDVPSSA